MGLDSKVKLPLIELELNGTKWEWMKSQVHQAVVEYGCFEVVFDQISCDLQKAIFVEVEKLFNLPLQTKQRVVSNRPYHGYVGPTQLYESIGILDADSYHKVETLLNILWPEGNPTFSKNLQSFTEKVSKLDQIIRKMILESLGVEKYLEEHINSTNYLIRMMKYNGPQSNEAKAGLEEHTDKNILTILCQNQIDGLEVRTKSGEWIKYKPSTSNSFVVVIGESFYAWTNGWLHPPFHRVMMSGNETRFSIGLFTVPKQEFIIKAPQELVTEDHPLLFKPFVQSEFMKFLRSSEGLKNALKVYCGV